MQVRLNVPEESLYVNWCERDLPGVQLERKSPEVHGMYLAHHGQTGEVIAGAANGGVFVRFNESGYVGCPARWLEAV